MPGTRLSTVENYQDNQKTDFAIEEVIGNWDLDAYINLSLHQKCNKGNQNKTRTVGPENHLAQYDLFPKWQVVF